MSRTTVYNRISHPELLDKVSDFNKELGEDFLDYLQSTDRAESTILQYRNDLNIFWSWNVEFNGNKNFTEIRKRDFAKFQNHALNEWGWGSKRVRRVKSVLSSMSNFIENILDEEPEFEGYRSVVKKIENPALSDTREKTIFQLEDLQKLLDTLVEKEKYDQACCLALEMYSGRRKAEIPRFKMSYFDDENLVFEGSMYKTPEKVKTKGRGKQGKLLNLYVLAHPFQPYLDLWKKERERLGINSEWLFPQKIINGKYNDDEPVLISTLDSWATTWSGILNSDFYHHSMRHFFTTYLSQSGIPANVIQQIVGWSDISLVSVYDDTPADDEIGKYFGAEGIKQVEQTTINDL